MYDTVQRIPLAEEKTTRDMVRQCAWCLRLIDAQGGRISAQPVPKVYEATHGMCITCGESWMVQFAEAQGVEAHELWQEIPFTLIAHKTTLKHLLNEHNKPIDTH